MVGAPRVPDQAFPCLCLNRQVQIWFPNQGHCRTDGHHRHYFAGSADTPSRDRLSFRLKIHL